MSYKDDGAKQTQNDRDHLNHFDAPGYTLPMRVIGDPGFRPASSGPENGFAGHSCKAYQRPAQKYLLESPLGAIASKADAIKRHFRP
jgi:hypothetical protein